MTQDPVNSSNRTWLVQDLIPLGMAGVLCGPPDAGKSTLALQLAYELARPEDEGFDWAGFGRPAGVGSRRTLIACYEDDILELRRRFYRINGLSEQLPPAVVENVSVIERMRALGPLWAQDPIDRWAPGGPTDAWYVVFDEAQEFNADLLILDPLASVFLDNENDRGRVRLFMDALNKWAEDNACTVLLTDYLSESEEDTTELSDVTDWRSGARFTLFLEPYPVPHRLRTWERAGVEIPDLLRETAVLEPGTSRYVPPGSARIRFLRLPPDGCWQTVDQDEVVAAHRGLAGPAV